MLDFETVISSDRVILRPMELDDYEGMRALTVDVDMWYYFTSDLSDPMILKQWVHDAIKEYESEVSLPFIIIDRKTNQIIGSTRISNISIIHQRVEIGWTWIAKEYHGTGINGHVKKLLFEYLFKETDALRIEFKTDVLNVPARKAMEKVGLVEEGILRSHTLMVGGRRRDTIYYSMLKSEWLIASDPQMNLS